jgi:hypothetical protein
MTKWWAALLAEILTETPNSWRHGSRNLYLDPKGGTKFPASGRYQLSGQSGTPLATVSHPLPLGPGIPSTQPK